jgi:parallel beta-helix repeat protein
MKLIKLKLIPITLTLLLSMISLSQSLPIYTHLAYWTSGTIPEGRYVNIHQISTPYGDGISVDTKGYPGAYEYLYTFFAYYKQIFIVPSSRAVEIKGYFLYNDTSYIVEPSRKYLAAYILQPDLHTIIATIHILDYDYGDMPNVWYYKHATIQNLTSGQQYYLAFGRYDHFSYERYLQAMWASVDLAPPHIIRVPQDFATIQEAINNATNSDIIQVSSGVYNETLTIEKTITLVGQDKTSTIINASQNDASIVILRACNVTVTGFSIRNNGRNPCIFLISSPNTKITKNIITDGQYGISLDYSNGTLITENRIIDNKVGIQITWNSNNTTMYHNSFINNTQQAEIDTGLTNTSDDGFEEGNYWSDYTGQDLNKDGIGDTNLPWLSIDNFPLMKPYLEGDVNHNGVVNSADVALLVIAWQSQQGEPNYNPHADLNLDGIINSRDFAIIATHWLNSGY